jgi:hypothetical protein
VQSEEDNGIGPPPRGCSSPALAVTDICHRSSDGSWCARRGCGDSTWPGGADGQEPRPAAAQPPPFNRVEKVLIVRRTPRSRSRHHPSGTVGSCPRPRSLRRSGNHEIADPELVSCCITSRPSSARSGASRARPCRGASDTHPKSYFGSYHAGQMMPPAGASGTSRGCSRCLQFS